MNDMAPLGGTMKHDKSTMAGVAKLAGVSTATVARVIYQNGYVKSSTREAVLRAIDQTAYRPNVFARGLRTKRSATLGLVSESELNPFFTKVAKEVQAQALTRGYTVLALNHNGLAAVEEHGVQQFIDQQVAAIIFCSAAKPGPVRRAVAAGIRVVQVEREVASVGQVILVDAMPGMRAAIQHLHELGHSRIGYIGGQVLPHRQELQPSRSNEALRISAFRRAVAELGLTLPQDYVQLGRYFDPDTGLPTDGATLMDRIIAVNPRPTAIVIGSDLIAAGSLQAVHARGLRVPDDLSIVGYDNSLSSLSPPRSPQLRSRWKTWDDMRSNSQFLNMLIRLRLLAKCCQRGSCCELQRNHLRGVSALRDWEGGVARRDLAAAGPEHVVIPPALLKPRLTHVVWNTPYLTIAKHMVRIRPLRKLANDEYVDRHPLPQGRFIVAPAIETG